MVCHEEADKYNRMSVGSCFALWFVRLIAVASPSQGRETVGAAREAIQEAI